MATLDVHRELTYRSDSGWLCPFCSETLTLLQQLDRPVLVECWDDGHRYHLTQADLLMVIQAGYASQGYRPAAHC